MDTVPCSGCSIVGINNKIDGIHERSLGIFYNYKSSSFQDLLDKDNSVTMHHRNIRTLTIETFKVVHGLSPPLLNEVFVERNCNYNLQGNDFFNRPRVNSVRYGTESVSFLTSKIWDTLPKEIKNSETPNAKYQKLGSSGISLWTLQNICLASRIYLRNNNTVHITM